MHTDACRRVHAQTHAHANPHTCTHSSDKLIIVRSLGDGEEKQLLRVFPSVLSPIRWAKLQVFTTCSICENTGSKHYLHRSWKDSQNNRCEGNLAIPAKLSMLLLFGLPGIPLLEFYPTKGPVHIQNDIWARYPHHIAYGNKEAENTQLVRTYF